MNAHIAVTPSKTHQFWDERPPFYSSGGRSMYREILMDNNDHFSVSQLPNYSTEKVASHLNAFLERSRIISQLRIQYNDKVGAYLDNKSLPQEERLSLAETWSGVRDTAKEMSEDAMKKAWACRVELDLRERE